MQCSSGQKSRVCGWEMNGVEWEAATAMLVLVWEMAVLYDFVEKEVRGKS